MIWDEQYMKEIIKESLQEFFFSEDEYSPFNRLLDKLNQLIEITRIEDRAEVSLKTCEKVEDYMKNIDRLNSMINEFKGLVAIVRGQKKEEDKDTVMDRLDMIEEELQRMSRMQRQLALIIKRLGKHE